jgi:hypothetical protein
MRQAHADAALAMFRALSVIAYTDSLRDHLAAHDPMALRQIDAARADALRSHLIDFNGEQPGGFIPADLIDGETNRERAAAIFAICGRTAPDRTTERYLCRLAPKHTGECSITEAGQ